MSYIIGIKPGDHKFLFEWINGTKANEYTMADDKGVEHKFKYHHNVPINDANFDYRVTVINYTEIKPNGREQHFTWITKLSVSNENIYQVMRAGRARWKIENETFNTLKNQGYNFEHNYGHGNKHLCSVMTMLMLLAFLIDQVQQLCSIAFQKARRHCGPFMHCLKKYGR